MVNTVSCGNDKRIYTRKTKIGQEAKRYHLKGDQEERNGGFRRSGRRRGDTSPLMATQPHMVLVVLVHMHTQ